MSDCPREEAEGNGGHGAKTVPILCKFCGAEFVGIEAVRDHKREKLQEEYDAEIPYVHLWCDICDLDFNTLTSVARHRRQYHAEKQDLSCPGCGEHFVKLSEFIRHIELSKCPQLDLWNLKARVHQRMSWVKGIGAIDKMSKEDVLTRHEKSFYQHLGHDPNPNRRWDPSDRKPLPWQAQDGWDQPEPVGFEDENFTDTTRHDYLRGHTKAPDLLTGDENNQCEGEDDDNVWVKKKNLFPNAPVSKKPNAEQLARLEDNQRVAAQRTPGTNLDLADPNNPMFSADKFWVEYIRKYKCSHKDCKKSFPKQSTFVQHLRSTAHRGTKTSCPACHGQFDSLFALAAHVESQSEKCHMRQSKAFGWFLDQLTWGTAEVGGSHGDSMQKYQLQKDFLDDYGPQKTTRPTYGHEQVYGSRELDRSAASVSHPQLTAGALAKQQQEMMRSGKPSKPYEQQQLQQKQQQDSDEGEGGVGGSSVPLTAEALSRLDLQDQPKGAGSWFQTSGDTRGRPSDNIWGQSCGPPVTQQQHTGGSWDQPSHPQENQQQNEGDWYQPSGYGPHGGGDYMW